MEQELKGKDFFLFVAILFSLSSPRRRREVYRLPAPPTLSAASSACKACCGGEGPCQLCAFKVMAKAALAEKQRGALARPHQALLGKRIRVETSVSQCQALKNSLSSGGITPEMIWYNKVW